MHAATPMELLRTSPGLRSLLIRTGISKLGNSVAHFALPLLILARTGSATSMAMGIFFECAPHFLFGPLLGSLADRVDRRRMLIVSDLLQIALTLSVAAYLGLFPDSSSVWPLYVACFLATSIDVAYWVVAEFCVVPQLVPDGALGAANSLYFATATSAGILGPLVGGTLLGLGSPGMVFALDACTFLATLSLWWSLPSSAFGGSPTSRGGTTFEAMGRSLRLFFGHPTLLPLFTVLCLSNFASSSRTSMLVYHWGKELGLAQTDVGVRVSVLATMAILGNLVSPYLTRYAREGSLFAVHWTLTILLNLAIGFGIGGEKGLGFAVLWMEFMGAAVWIYTFHARQVLVPREALAGVNSIARAMLLAAYSLGSFTFLPLAESAGIRVAMAGQVIPLVLALALWFRRRDLWRLQLAGRGRSEV